MQKIFINEHVCSRVTLQRPVIANYAGSFAKATLTHLTLSECWGQFADIYIIREGVCEEFGMVILTIITAPGVICY